MKRLLCGVSMALLSVIMTVSAAAKSTLFYSKTSTGQEFAALMPQWNGVAGTFAEQTPDGVRIGTKNVGGAMFSFPTYINPELNDWTGIKYVEINVINEKEFGTHLAVIIMDNETNDANNGHEMFQLKANTPAYIEDTKGNVYKRTSFGNGVFIPGSFKGKLYVPLDTKYLESLSWATRNGELDMKHISNIAYYLNNANASVIIGDVFKTDKDPSKSVQPTTKVSVSTKPHPSMSITSTTISAASSDPTGAATTAAQTDANDHGIGNLWVLLGCTGGAAAIIAGALIYFLKRKKSSAKESNGKDSDEK